MAERDAKGLTAKIEIVPVEANFGFTVCSHCGIDLDKCPCRIEPNPQKPGVNDLYCSNCGAYFTGSYANIMPGGSDYG